MSAKPFEPMTGGWEWPADLPRRRTTQESSPRNPTDDPQDGQPSQTEQSSRPPQPEQPKKKWGPRTCRICFETVLPTYHMPSENIPGIFQSAPNVTYESDDGRLIRPCKCKGSSKYVHEGCLQAWRHADRDYGRRNYWECPTCGFRYRLERMHWGRAISSTATQISLTVGILVFAMFSLGFVADPIINFYLDPYGWFNPFSSGHRVVYEDDLDLSSWPAHFVKGFASLGLLSFLKVVLTSPFQWFNLRHTFGGSARTAPTGRDRLANISWIVVLIGVLTFLYAVWKGVRAWSRRTLEKASERVMDVHADDDDDEEEE